jgi:FkbM family methyltransferase
LLPAHRRSFKLYDFILGEIARVAIAKYPDAVAIDIGANIGDTAAVLCRHQNLPVLCIEGHPEFLAFLRKNLARLPDGIEIADCLLGPQPRTVPLASLKAKGGTATMTATTTTAPDDSVVAIRTLSDVLREHPRFEHPRLIKSDTDGADFEILSSSLDIISREHPLLYFEYSLVEHKSSLVESIALIEQLVVAGYNRFLVYDNFGNLMQVISDNFVTRFRNLNRYVMSNILFGRSVYYLDVCACHQVDADLAAALYRFQCQLVDGNSTRMGWNA